MIVLRGQSQTKFLRSLDTSMWRFPVEFVGCLRYKCRSQVLRGLREIYLDYFGMGCMICRPKVVVANVCMVLCFNNASGVLLKAKFGPPTAVHYRQHSSGMSRFGSLSLSQNGMLNHTSTWPCLARPSGQTPRPKVRGLKSNSPFLEQFSTLNLTTCILNA